MGASSYLLDTDVLIDVLRDNSHAAKCIENLAPCFVSVLSIVELWAGVHNAAEGKAVNALLGLLDTIEVSEPIARRAGIWRARYGRSHGTGVIDAIIAASAEENGLTLVSLNKKHFPMVSNFLVPYKKSL